MSKIDDIVRAALDDDAKRNPAPRPIDVIDGPTVTKWCSCGERIPGYDRMELASSWYGHLADVVVTDPTGRHELEPF